MRLEAALGAHCGVDDSTPVAVGHDFDYQTTATECFALACRQCGLARRMRIRWV
jgi:hypothetical protein